MKNKMKNFALATLVLFNLNHVSATELSLGCVLSDYEGKKKSVVDLGTPLRGDVDDKLSKSIPMFMLANPKYEDYLKDCTRKASLVQFATPIAIDKKSGQDYMLFDNRGVDDLNKFEFVKGANEEVLKAYYDAVNDEGITKQFFLDLTRSDSVKIEANGKSQSLRDIISDKDVIKKNDIFAAYTILKDWLVKNGITDEQQAANASLFIIKYTHQAAIDAHFIPLVAHSYWMTIPTFNSEYADGLFKVSQKPSGKVEVFTSYYKELSGFVGGAKFEQIKSQAGLIISYKDTIENSKKAPFRDLSELKKAVLINSISDFNITVQRFNKSDRLSEAAAKNSIMFSPFVTKVQKPKNEDKWSVK